MTDMATQDKVETLSVSAMCNLAYQGDETMHGMCAKSSASQEGKYYGFRCDCSCHQVYEYKNNRDAYSTYSRLGYELRSSDAFHRLLFLQRVEFTIRVFKAYGFDITKADAINMVNCIEKMRNESYWGISDFLKSIGHNLASIVRLDKVPVL